MSGATDALEGKDSKREAAMKVFSPEFLAAVRGLDGVSVMGDAARSRPLSLVVQRPGLWHVVTVGSDDRLLGRFTDKELATLFCAAYPSAERDVTLQFGSDPEDGGYPLWWTRGNAREKCGELPIFDPDTVDAMKSLLRLASDPVSLSYLLEFAGWLAVEAAGEILLERLKEEGCVPCEGGGAS